jgi:RNA polymerase sigma-B factor
MYETQDALAGRRHPSDRQPDPETVAAWCQEFSVTRDPLLRKMIVERHRWLAEICARQVRGRNEPLDDLVQAAQLALLLALDRFDPKFGVAFRTFASATISGELRRHYRSTWRVRVPRRLQELHLSVAKTIEYLTASLNRSPTVDDIAAFLAVHRDEVIEAIAAGASYWPTSVHNSSDTGEFDQCFRVDDPHFDDAEARADLRPILEVLPPRERVIVYLRFFRELTQTEIADELKISQVHVSRLMRKALCTLRANNPRNPVELGSTLAVAR